MVQKLFYIGVAISITTLIACISYISKDKIKIIYQKHIKKNLLMSRESQLRQKPSSEKPDNSIGFHKRE